MTVSTPWSAVRISVFAIVGLLVVGFGVAFGVSTFRQDGLFPQHAAADRPAPTQAAQPLAPSFDIVRVSPDGSAVIAGRAEPGAIVSVQQNERIVGQARADSHGSWVMTPSLRLPPGAAELTLSAEIPSRPTLQAAASVVVVVPNPAAPGVVAAPALALLAQPAAPSKLLQAPASATPGRKLGLDTVDYDEHGAIRFSGSAPPDAPVRMYVDNKPVGDSKAGADGHWAMSPPAEMPPGVHTLQLDQITPLGRVTARVELPFQRETLAASQVVAGQVVVQPGQNLWRLARRAYGTGIRYTVIFLANHDQIRDARLIYPGQVFAVPGASLPTATP